MHMEVQVALNFVLSYLYNKLPRRRVNIFGEELEKAMKDKFYGHWYPEKPFKGSAFRCLKTGDQIDKVLERAAFESGVTIHDILEHLPQELAVWIDPGEVSYRIGEKGAVKILFSDKDEDPQAEHSADREVTKTFNPEAQCFRPIDDISCTLAQLNMPSKGMPNPHQAVFNAAAAAAAAVVSHSAGSSPTGAGFKGAPSSAAAFVPRSTVPLTFTTATFAQTKFGSTKLKTSSKRANRMSPTEFSNYIKQRAAIQQQFHQHQGCSLGSGGQQMHHSPVGRALSPDTSKFYYSQYNNNNNNNNNRSPHNSFPNQRSIFESSSNQQFVTKNNRTTAANGDFYHALTATGKLPYVDPANSFLPLYQSVSNNNGNHGGGNNNTTTTTTTLLGMGEGSSSTTAAAVNNNTALHSIMNSNNNDSNAIINGTSNINANNNSFAATSGSGAGGTGTAANTQDALDNVWPYNSTGQYQHLLVAN